MRTIVCGSRDAPLFAVAVALARCGWTPSVVLSGGARGADAHGEAWAKGAGIPVERYPADWDRHGKVAGFMRNAEMVTRAEAVVAVWDGSSHGTADTVRRATEAGLRVFVHQYAGEGAPR